MERKERLRQRNQKIRKFIADLEQKHPEWRFDAVVKEAAKNFFLAGRTIEAILRKEGVYAD